MKKILISRGVRPLRNGKRSAKDYPYWDDLIARLKAEGHEVEEIAELPMDELKSKIEESLVVICPDSFVQHFCWYIGKKAIVLWGQGDPLIFGHAENINLLKSRNNLRSDQFQFWDDVKYDPTVFVSPAEVVEQVRSIQGE